MFVPLHSHASVSLNDISLNAYVNVIPIIYGSPFWRIPIYIYIYITYYCYIWNLAIFHIIIPLHCDMIMCVRDNGIYLSFPVRCQW